MSETTTAKVTPNKRVERALRDLSAVGRSWGKSALETSATRLRRTADWLATLSQRVSPAKDGAAATETRTETTSQQ